FQREPFAASANPEWRMRSMDSLRLSDGTIDMEEAAIEHRRTLRPHAVNDFECFLQAPQTLRGFREDVAVCVGLARVPTSAKPDIQSAVTRTVDCRCHLCE